MLKKALVAAALVTSLVTTSAINQPESQRISSSHDRPPERSVQVLYRPVLSQRIPDAPKQRGDKAWVWWTEQLTRIKHGWREPITGKYICGYHYWYLNFVKIPRQDKETNTITGWDAPYYRDNDDDIFSVMWNGRQRTTASGRDVNATNSVFAKPRTIGYTQMEFLGVDSYHFLFCAGRERYIGRGYPVQKTLDIERGWFRTLYAEHIHPFFKTYGGRELEILTDNSENFSVGHKSGKEKTDIIHNWMQYRIVPDEQHAGVFKSMRATKLTAVEAGLWSGNSLDNFYVENQDSLRGGDSQWGMMVVGGTSNAVINKSSNYRTMWVNAESDYNATAHFTPKTRGLLGFIDLYTGRSLQDDALRWVMSEREKAEGNSEKAQKEKVENPLTWQEAFEPSMSFAYDQAKLMAQIGYVKTHELDKMWITGRIEYIRGTNNKKVEFLPDPENTPDNLRGPWMINRAGMPTDRIPNLHVGAIDDTFKGLKPGQKLNKRDSRNCMVIWRQPSLLLGDNNDIPCALYYERNPDMDATYHEFLKGMLLYNIQQTIYEFNHWAFIFWLRDRGEGNRLYWINDHTPGLEVKGNKKTELTGLGYRFLAEDRHHGITLLPLLESLMLWGSGQNDDIGSAFHCLLFLLHSTKDWVGISQEEEVAYARQLSDYIQLGQNYQPNDQARVAEDYIRLGSPKTRTQWAA